jgi:F-type H+-transporting ATPase subunit epsilon
VATIDVELVAPDRIVWSGEADIVIARTTDGDIGILPNHEPLLAVLVEHPVTIRRTDGDALVVAVLGGFLSVTPEKVSILAENVETADEIDVAAAREELDRSRGSDEDEDKAAVRRATARLRVAGETV